MGVIVGKKTGDAGFSHKNCGVNYIGEGDCLQKGSNFVSTELLRVEFCHLCSLQEIICKI